ncbi:hypothetical protein IEE_05474, partial [Bacillus cereus BAG5X1-1]
SVRADAQTVQREVNVQDSVRGAGAVNESVRADSQTVQREVNVQDSVKENSNSKFRQRGSSNNRVDSLRRR